jgi:hypothetical protein
MIKYYDVCKSKDTWESFKSYFPEFEYLDGSYGYGKLIYKGIEFSVSVESRQNSYGNQYIRVYERDNTIKIPLNKEIDKLKIMKEFDKAITKIVKREEEFKAKDILRGKITKLIQESEFSKYISLYNGNLCNNISSLENIGYISLKNYKQELDKLAKELENRAILFDKLENEVTRLNQIIEGYRKE